MRAIPSGRLAVAVIAALVVVAVVISGVLLGGSDSKPTTADPVKKSNQVKQPKYVALGSSFASGVGEGKPVGFCGQTQDNYPRQVAQELDMKLVDASCAGAVIADVLNPSVKRPKRVAQIESVTPDTSLVTLTIGGNDLSYIGRLVTSVCANLAAGLYLPPLGKYCQTANWPTPIPDPTRYASVESSLVQTVEAIRARAPKARVVLVNYLPVVSMTEPPCEGLPLEPWQVIETHTVATELAAATARAAKATNAQYVDTQALGAAHTTCSPKPWIISYGKSMPFHPNAEGKAAVADAVVGALR
ncbi:MAG: SGNH/GDSL hydrolase family protein [Gordonia sp. (in: high G+C Gram-positive bacteria)]|uniref:SGNH/GDSL hydrolase family protein n=1 Tax=Gordonia sp. (in: high G+C Gram-positive bacteria) TaxID=84139 RepID=UPI0039E5A175